MKILSSASAARYYQEITKVDSNINYDYKAKVKDLRAVSDTIFKEITKNSPRFLACTGSRSAYVFDTYKVEKDLKDELDGFRHLANERVHELGLDVSEEDYLAGIKALSTAVNKFAEEAVPQNLLVKYLNRDELSLKKYINKPKFESVDFMALTIKKIIPPKPGYPNKRVTIQGTADGFGEVQIQFWDDRDNPSPALMFASLAEQLWPYCRINLLNLNYDSNLDFYATTRTTQVVVQPDYLIDASELAECFDDKGASPACSMLKRLFHVAPKEALIFGSLINSLLDGIVLNPDVKLVELFKDAIRENPLGMLYLCNNEGVYNNQKLGEMLRRADDHGKTIYSVLQRYNDFDLQLEPSFLSDVYGLQGRLDVFAINKQEPHRKHIIELKSGKLPWNQAHLNESHLMQVQCYEMLIESAFKAKPEKSAILYSIAENAEQAVRDLRPTQRNPGLLLWVRNQIVINEYLLSQGDLNLIDKFKEANFGHVPKFEKEKLEAVQQVLESASDLEKAYFTEYSSFIAREHRTAKIGSDEEDATEGFAGLWRQSISKKHENYSILDTLSIASAEDPEHIVLKKGEDLFGTGSCSNFREGDIGVLYPMVKGDSRDVLRARVLKCNIKKVTDTEVHVSLRNKQVNKAYFSEYTNWAIEPDMMERGYKDMHKALFSFLKSPQEKRNLLMGLEKPRFEELSYNITGDLSDEQRSLVQRALSAKDYFLLQGPPGTGKTSRVLRYMAENLYKQTEECFAIIAFTNRAVDEICEHLQKAGLPYIRLTKRPSTDPNTLSCLAKDLNLGDLHTKISDTRIFVSTQATFNSCYDIVHFKKFNTIIVDEASQLLEPQLIGLLPVFERFILIGDDKQLPAVVTQPDRFTKLKCSQLAEAGFTSLKDSLFARLVRTCENNGWHEAYGMLTAQGRMHQSIADFVNKRYYGGRLRAIRDDQAKNQEFFKSNSEDKYERALAASRVIFIPTKVDSTNKVNKEEVSHVEQLLKTIHRVYGSGFTNETVGVVTPYRSQIATITRSAIMLKEPFDSMVSVDTVERFQGSERDVIILSMAVNSARQLDLLQSLTDTPDGSVDRKLNVALTRAKQQLVIMGCEEVLSHSQDYAALIQYIKETGGYIDCL